MNFPLHVDLLLFDERCRGLLGKLARLRRDVYDSIEDLKRSILDFIDLHNEKEAKPFRWTASPERLAAFRQREYQKIGTGN